MEIPDNWAYSKIGEIADVSKRAIDISDLPDDLPVTFIPMASVDAESGTVKKPEIRSLGEVKKVMPNLPMVMLFSQKSHLHGEWKGSGS